MVAQEAGVLAHHIPAGTGRKGAESGQSEQRNQEHETARCASVGLPRTRNKRKLLQRLPAQSTKRPYGMQAGRQPRRPPEGLRPFTHMMLEAMTALLSLPRVTSHRLSRSRITVTRKLHRQGLEG